MVPFKSIIRRIDVEEISSIMRGNFLIITVCVALSQSLVRMFFPYESVYMKFLGASSIALGMFFAISRLVGAVMTIPGGYLSDAHGRKRVIIIGSFTTAAIRFLVALSRDWRSYLITCTLLSMSSFWNAAESALLVDSMRVSRRGLCFSIYWMVMQLAGLISPYIGGIILETRGEEGLRLILLLVAIADTLRALIYAKFLEETLTISRKVSAFNIRSLFAPLIDAFRILRVASRSIKGFCLLQVINGFSWSMIMPFIILYALQVISLSPSQWGFISTIESVVILTLRIPGGILADRCSRKSLLLIASLWDIGYFMVFINSRSFLQIFIAIIIRRIVLTLADPAWPALQADLIPRRQRGRVFSILNALSAFSGFFGSIVGGYLFDMNPAFPFWFFIPLNFIGFLVLLSFIQEPQKPEE